MHIAILGRQPALGMAELESIYGADSTRWFSDVAAIVDTDNLLVNRLGGTQKAGRIITELHGDWRQASAKIVQTYTKKWGHTEGKITLGISAYGFKVNPRDVQKTGIILKQKLKTSDVSLRLIPNAEPALNTATSHHNKLGLAPNKVELIVVRSRDGKILIAESTGAQNITAYTKRDQERPKRDAFVGMLPPKLAQIIINLASPSSRTQSRSVSSLTGSLQPEIDKAGPLFDPSAKLPSEEDEAEKAIKRSKDETLRLLDPFCGTGVILQEAALQGYNVYGTDLSEKMIDYSQVNLDWLSRTHHVNIVTDLHPGDARTTQWQPPIDLVACESYLGQPFSAPPSSSKLTEVRGNCNRIISEFLENIASQLSPGTPLCVAVPAWQNADGSFAHLPIINSLDQLGYTRHNFKNIKNSELLYYREDQIVARELLVLVKT